MTARRASPDTALPRSLLSGFLAHAAQSPDAPALTVKGAVLSYSAIEATARQWASAILAALGRPAGRVGVFAYRDEESYVGVLAALMSGAAFVPLNRAFPVKRTAFMIRRADLDAIIVDRESAAQLEEVLGGLERPPLVLFPADESHDVSIAGVQVLSRPEVESSTPLDTLPPLGPEDIAYILFTSGSTGEPKGVSVSHGNVLHFVDVATRRYSITSNDRFSQTFDQTFDPSVFDLFGAWGNGACVCSMQPIDLLVPDRFVARHAVTIWCSVPSVPALSRRKNLLRPGAMPSLRWSLFGGEVLTAEVAQAWLDAAPSSTVENLYGPTELTVACLAYRWNSAVSPSQCVKGAVPIGRPFEGLTAVIVDEDLRISPPGEAGELLVCGPQTAPGYWREPEKTQERFVTLDAAAFEGMRFYRTGDKAVLLESGEYLYLGRIDYQIKILGHRVELGEIEAVLRDVARVDQAVALGWPLTAEGADGVVAFVAAADCDSELLKSLARDRLPDYMVPKRIFPVHEMPLNRNGKVDRNELQRRLESLSDTRPNA